MPNTVRRQDAQNDNLLLIVGQLLEATKAAGESIRGLNAEVQSNAKTIIALAKTVEAVENALSQLEHMVKDATNPDNLVRMNSFHASQITELSQTVMRLGEAVKELRAWADAATNTHAKVAGFGKAFWIICGGVAWAITTAVSVVGALHK